jgi:hypothetical protein
VNLLNAALNAVRVRCPAIEAMCRSCRGAGGWTESRVAVRRVVAQDLEQEDLAEPVEDRPAAV